MTKDDCQRLLLEYPELNTAYELHVNMNSENDKDRQSAHDDEANHDSKMDVDERATPSNRH